MWTEVFRKRRKSLLIGALVGGLLTLAFLALQNDINRNNLDPKIPFQIYKIPAAPDYGQSDAWYLNPALAHYYADPRKLDVFFVHATSYDGGRNWLGAVDSHMAQDEVQRVQLPNYAAPFAVMGNIYAPKYRQASLYTQLTLREDAREARQFAYRDVQRAFATFLRQRRGGRGFAIVGVEQGGLLAERLIRDEVAAKPEVRSQLVAAYLLENLAPDSQYSGVGAWPPVCKVRQETGCLFSYFTVDSGRPDLALQQISKAVYWQGDTLAALGSQKAVCVNPLIGGWTSEAIDSRHSLGATNATGLEWGTEPPLIAHKVSAHCLGGLLVVDKPNSPSFRDKGTWTQQRKVNMFNLFYGDLQADFQARWQTFQTASAPAS